MTMTVEQAESALSDFQARRAAHIDRLGKMREQKTKIAPAALSGNAAKKTKLDKLNRDIAAAALELEDFDAAIAAACRDLDQARTDEAWNEQCAKADEGLAMLPKVRARADEISRGLQTFLEGLDELARDVDALTAAGAMIPSREMRRVMFKNAFHSALTPRGLNSEVIAPGQRRKIEDVIGAWLDSAERSLHARKNPQAFVAPDPVPVPAPESAERPSAEVNLDEGFRMTAEEFDRLEDEAA